MKLKLALFLGIVACARAQVPVVPIETFFGTNYIRGATLSPDGTKIAFLAPKGDTYSLAILDLATHKVTIPFHPEGDSLDSVHWKGNDHLVFTAIIDGVEGAPLLGVTNVEGTRVFSLMPAAKNTEDFSILSGSLENILRGDPGHVLCQGYTLNSDPNDHESGGNNQPMLMKIDILHGERTFVSNATDPEPLVTLSDFGVDHAGHVRTANRFKGDTQELLYRDTGSDPWKPLRKDRSDSPAWEVAGFTGDNAGVYIIDHEANDRGSLRVYDPQTGSLGPVLFTPDAGEIERLIFSPDQKRLIGLVYNADKRYYHYFEPKYASLQAKMENTFPGDSVIFADISDDESRILVRTYSDRSPGAYFLLDLSKGGLGFVTTAGAKIDPKTMAEKQPISFTARDGLVVHGYLSLPVGFKPGHPVPLIIHPHGGPFGIRDDWGFDPEVQFMANRGYAVLQVNYRGSGGYGSSFEKAGYKEWGGKMQDDLTDSVKWAIEKGYADPKRVGIVGASYGGYATLAGLTFTPELYKCGVNYVGVSDLKELVRPKDGVLGDSISSFYRLRIGSDSKVLEDHSPVNFVENIRVPLLNAYGENDKRVEIFQWKELKSQLDKYHKDYDYIVAKGEGHGFRHPADAVAFYTKVEAFLQKNL